MRLLVLFAFAALALSTSCLAGNNTAILYAGDAAGYLANVRQLALDGHSGREMKANWPDDHLTRPSRHPNAIKVKTRPGEIQFEVIDHLLKREVFWIKGNVPNGQSVVSLVHCQPELPTICTYPTFQSWEKALMRQSGRFGETVRLKELSTEAEIDYETAAMSVKTEIERLPYYENRRFDYREFPMPIQAKIVNVIDLYWYACQWRSVYMTSLLFGQINS